MKKTVCSALLLILFNVPAWATPAQSLASIQQIATDYLTQTIQQRHINGRLEVVAGKLDNRLRLPQCPVALTAYLPTDANPIRATTVGVKCPQGQSWSLFVPVRVNIYTHAIVSPNTIARGSLIRYEDVTLTEVNINQLHHGYFSQTSEVVGKLAKRQIRPGTVINRHAIAEPMIVKRGQPVTIHASKGGLTVSMKGEAMQDGAIKSLIRVKNLASGRVIRGTIVGSGQVSVTIN